MRRDAGDGESVVEGEMRWVDENEQGEESNGEHVVQSRHQGAAMIEEGRGAVERRGIMSRHVRDAAPVLVDCFSGPASVDKTGRYVCKACVIFQKNSEFCNDQHVVAIEDVI